MGADGKAKGGMGLVPPGGRAPAALAAPLERGPMDAR